jgi:hypothetical protein
VVTALERYNLDVERCGDPGKTILVKGVKA